MKTASTSPKSRTDLARLKALSDTHIVIDGDAPAWTPAAFAKVVVRKVAQDYPDVALDEKAVRVGAPTLVISTPVSEATDFRAHYDVTLDGQRFLMRRPTGPGSPALTVMMNWAAGLKH